MGLLRKRAWWQKLIHSRLTLGVLLILSVAISFTVYDRYVIEREVAARRHEKEVELSGLEEKKAVLGDKVEYLKGEQGMESEIRKHFDVARSGEQVVVLTGESSLQATATSVAIPEKKSWWRKILPW